MISKKLMNDTENLIHLPVMNERKSWCRSMLRILKINLMEKRRARDPGFDKVNMGRKS
jgi:hypothetical protein